jgi:hypothetical protein
VKDAFAKLRHRSTSMLGMAGAGLDDEEQSVDFIVV